jgi:4,5-dihydroxyphthalate decarboxylase
MLPWLLKHVEETRSMMGEDFWPYGFEPNVHTLETFLRYSHEQGLSKRQLNPRELFAPETFESFKV